MATATNRFPAKCSGVVFKNLFGQLCQQAGSSANSGRCVTLLYGTEADNGPNGLRARAVPGWCNVLSRALRNCPDSWFRYCAPVREVSYVCCIRSTVLDCLSTNLVTHFVCEVQFRRKPILTDEWFMTEWTPHEAANTLSLASPSDGLLVF